MQSLETKSSRPRPKSFETETRPETFETETRKNGSLPRPSLETPSPTYTATKRICLNCKGNHSSNDCSCPRYKCQEKVLKIKSENNITYAEAAEQYRGHVSSTASPQVSSRSEFPRLIPKGNFQPNPSPQIKPLQRY